MTCHSKSIYTDVYEIVSQSDYFFYLFIGGRGIGKTYSMLKNSYLNNEYILYLRRTQTELENTVNEINNPYRAININEGLNISVKAAGDNMVILSTEEDNDKIIGVCCALSTAGKTRSMDFSQVTMIIFDEFINTSPINNLKREDELLFNLIETVSRNRELEGKEPVKIVLLSNANTLDSGIIRSLKLADEISKMKIENRKLYTDEERGIYLELLDNKKVKDLKMKTRLYRLTKGTSFYDMALENEFTSDYFGDVKKINYNELQPVVEYDHIYFYRHKSKDIMFATRRKANCEHYDKNTLQAFKRTYGYMMDYYISSGLMFYADYNIKLEVLHIF